MFESDYLFLKNTPVVCRFWQTAGVFSKEDKIYSYLKRVTQNSGWKFIRVDTTNQIGFPDILLLKGQDYLQIEAKILRKKRLVCIEDDLKWQFGQLAYMQRALTLGLNYSLVVAKDNDIAFIKGRSNEKTKCADYPDFVKLI